MTPSRRQSAAIFAFAVIFGNPGFDESAVAALVTKVHHNRPIRNDIHETKNESLPPLSDTIIHVGNLDWKLPIHDVSRRITQAIGMCSEDDPNADIHDDSFQVTVAELPVPRRKRDEGKFHNGSAKVSFSSRGDAKQAMEALLLRANHNSWKVRWAVVEPPNAHENETETETVAETLERVEHRKRRAEKRIRARQKVARATDIAIESVLEHLERDEKKLLTMPTPVLKAPTLDWENCPENIDPTRGGKIRSGTQRGERKRAAVEAFLEVALEFLMADSINAANRNSKHADKTNPSSCKIADLGCGAGNLTVPLAWWLKRLGVHVLGVDINDQALALLSQRADRLGIAIGTLHKDLLYLSSGYGDSDNDDEWSECDAVVSLHACGAASDLSMEAAVRNELPFAISPCCIGKLSTERSKSNSNINNNRISKPNHGRMPPKQSFTTSADRSGAPSEVSYPRSDWLKTILPSRDEYKLLASAADYGVGGSCDEAVDTAELERRRRCRLSKKIIELDRLRWAKEHGYFVRLLEMPRIGPLYPKRELLLGAREGSPAAEKLLQLSIVV
jgi:SAM-dependent methyltransferase